MFYKKHTLKNNTFIITSQINSTHIYFGLFLLLSTRWKITTFNTKWEKNHLTFHHSFKNERQFILKEKKKNYLNTPQSSKQN